MEVFDVLHASPLFSKLSKNALWRLADIAQNKKFAVGEYLMQEGDEPTECFIIISGKVEVFRYTANKKKLVLGSLNKGEIVGELSIIDNEPRSASVMALEPTETFMIEQWDFKAQMQAYPEIALQLLPVIAKRLRQVQDQLAGVVLHG